MQSKMPIVLDTGIGTDIDDALALLLTLASWENASKLKFYIEDSYFRIHKVDEDEGVVYNVSVAVKAAEFEAFFLDCLLDLLYPV